MACIRINWNQSTRKVPIYPTHTFTKIGKIGTQQTFVIFRLVQDSNLAVVVDIADVEGPVRVGNEDHLKFIEILG